MDWIDIAAKQIASFDRLSEGEAAEIIRRCAPEPPLLICVDCSNTESCAGAMSRQFNHGRCLRCGGYFRVYRA